MKLRDLVCGIETVKIACDPDCEVTGITNDSRAVEPGFAFIAVRGYESDGHKYIDSAAEKGASVVFCEQAPQNCDLPYVIVENSRASEALIAANYYFRPAERLTMVGITGTNGKTTTTNLVKHIIEAATGEKCGLIGTNRNMIGDIEMPAERTTPDSIELQALLAQMADAGCKYCVMEVSSHALYLDRVRGIRFAVGAFTNLTEDHLDFHKTMDAYAEAKSRLFTMSEKSVINLDDSYSGLMIKSAAGEVFTYSTVDNAANLTAKDIRLKQDGVSFCTLTDGGIKKIRLKIPGLFSVYNALTAVSVAVELGIDMDAAISALGECGGVRGRAEVVPTGRDFTVLIDYAHTPDALENILKTVRGFAEGRVVLLFGCGGDRDRSKRPIMGAIAVKLADYVYITSDNPRTEEPMAIINEILEGVRGTKTPYEVIENRREAIFRAIENARAGDVIILAGKGHETYQIIGTEKRRFDEREVVREALGE